jgi:hypothetical protein
LLLWSAVLGPALVWLMLLQTNYLLAYPTCAARSNAWLYLASAVALALVLTLAAAAQFMWRTGRPRLEGGAADPDDPPGANLSIASRQFLSLMAVFMSVLFLLLVIGTALPPLVLHPCD